MSTSIGMFGKLPVAGDFVAHQASTPAGLAFQTFLQLEVNYLASKHCELPAEPVRFLFRDEAGAGAIVGVFVPSQDKVGRRFPLSVFAALEAPVAAERLPWLPAAYAQFLDGAVAALRGAVEPEALVAASDGLPLPSAAELEEARVWTGQALEATAGQTILEALFGPLPGGVQFHGINMFRTACAQVRGNDPGKAGIILECPASDDVQLGFWLSFAHELLAWPNAPPCLFWTDVHSPDSRLLVALGAPASPGVLHFLADPAVQAERLWPMRTQNEHSIAAGRRALGPAVLQALEPPAPTAAALLRALVG